MNPEAILAIADGAPLTLGDLSEVKANRERVLKALDGDRPVYGVNTGMGRLAGVPLTVEQQAVHQRNLLLGRAVGGPPWLPERDVRALLAVRVHDLLAPSAGVSAELIQALADHLNNGYLPNVPRFGLGSAGEIIPLAHAFAELDFELGPKEGISLLQGSPLAVTHAILRGDEASRIVGLQLTAAAVAVDVLGAPRGIYAPELAGADEFLRERQAELTALTDGGEVRDLVQAPISVRVGPRALAHADRVLDDLRQAVLLDRPTDSPAFLDGEFVSTTGFHAVDLGLRMDAVTAALVHLGEISVQRMHRLLDPAFSGLTPQLAVDPGPQAGLTPLHKRAVGELHALRRLATPATLGSIDTSAGQEDVQAFAWAAGEQLRAAVEHLVTITACEFIAGSQAYYLRGHGAPGLREHYAWVAEIVPPVSEDRPLGVDVSRLSMRIARQ
ncbi:histidine ammonia-lyase [Amycolatopsis xylanica]|uniref:Histidine ammonia-lyase n=1 Tax=Amycolatopsis xylanica TaxID=589385 RepID=A0A1H3TBU2_9PSEU|nr:aromatic amino acid lyase [Amycolatopsis xylanica]SDZ47328.1 histidine ammonia-lyase [Amycolatopsis xylanica]